MSSIGGSIWAQNIGSRWVDSNTTLHDYFTLNFDNRDISAVVALAQVWPKLDNQGSAFFAKDFSAMCGFSSVVSNGQLEEFDTWPPRIIRFNVTQLTIATLAQKCFVRSVWSINLWE